MSTGDPAGLMHEQDDQMVVVDQAAPAQQKITARSPMQLFWRRLRRDKVAIIALAFIVVLVVMAILAPAIVSLAGALMLEQNDEWAVSRRYMSLESLAVLSDAPRVSLPGVAT